ncbi:hypothetical protein AYO44_11395 [Planctomycetaceae bacterium SCGC AG-212-F19]|nr:hypothetical protein AYO44_11395 [Planctomycetaceae bacterium SCGC AG-212-F19]
MGFETFRVELRGGTAPFHEVVEVLQKSPQVRPDPQAVALEASAFFVKDDGRHILELEVMDAPVKLSCRFTLCHPPSVDAAFLGFLREMMVRFGMAAKIGDDVRPEDARSFSLYEFEEFSTIAASYIAARRAEWIGAFGDEPLAATTSQVFQRIILPRCQPGISQPT